MRFRNRSEEHQRSIRSWCASRSHGTSEQTKILPRMSTGNSAIMMAAGTGKAWGAQKPSPHTIRNLLTNETYSRLSLEWPCSQPTPSEDLAFHREPLTAAFEFHGLSTSHEWWSSHVRGGGEGPASSGLELPPLSARLRLSSIRSSPASTTPSASDFVHFHFHFATLAAMTYPRP